MQSSYPKSIHSPVHIHIHTSLPLLSDKEKELGCVRVFVCVFLHHPKLTLHSFTTTNTLDSHGGRVLLGYRHTEKGTIHEILGEGRARVSWKYKKLFTCRCARECNDQVLSSRPGNYNTLLMFTAKQVWYPSFCPFCRRVPGTTTNEMICWLTEVWIESPCDWIKWLIPGHSIVF